MSEKTNDDEVVSRIKTKQERVKNHQRKALQRKKDNQAIRAMYQNEGNSDLVQHLLAKAREFAAYHITIAKDGVGARKTGYKLEDGSPEVENYFLKQSERVSHLDKAAGIDELIGYIERQMTVEVVAPKPTDEKKSE